MSAAADLQTRVTRGAGRGITFHAFQHELRTRDKRAAVDLICATFPRLSRSWAKRYLARVQQMPGDRLGQFIVSADPVTWMRHHVGLADPTGNTATRNVDMERAGVTV